ERHELAVRALAKVLRIALEFLDDLVPRVVALDRSERFPVPLKLGGLLLGDELQRPEHGLAEVTDEHWIRFHVAQRGGLLGGRADRARSLAVFVRDCDAWFESRARASNRLVFANAASAPLSC